MKIICATDFTPRARAAAKVAVDLARLTAGSVELVHIVPERSADIQALTVDVGVLEHEIRRGHQGQAGGRGSRAGEDRRGPGLLSPRRRGRRWRSCWRARGRSAPI